MSKDKTPRPAAPAPVSGKGALGAPLGRRYCPETHQWLEDAPASAADPQPAPVGEKE